jgi:hypothetical protein
VLEIVRPVTEILTPQSPQSGASAGEGQAPSAVGTSELPPAPAGTAGRRPGSAEPAERGRVATPGIQPPASGLPDWIGQTATPSAAQHAGSEGSAAAPPVQPRDAGPIGSSAAAGGPGSAFFTGFAVVALLGALAAPALGKRQKLRPEPLRLLLFVSPPERPG